MKKICVLIGLVSLFILDLRSQDLSKFKQLQEELPSPNIYRTASGAPGPNYWQQRADYEIEVELDDSNQRITGKEVITYFNNSPQELTYLWLQLDQNVRAKNSDARKIQKWNISDRMAFGTMEYYLSDFDGGYKISAVETENKDPLKYTINGTMMRVDLPRPLRSGDNYTFRVEWNYNINDCRKIGGRSGYEYFPEDDNYLYEMAQWFPRMAVYDDVNGWQNKQFLGRGEFALVFGNYKVTINVPADHVVASTGELQNPVNALSDEQKDRLKEAKKSDKPIFIVTPEEAKKNETSAKTKERRNWIFYAENVRDFAWASSRKFIWDAKNVKIGDKDVMAMSFYPNEGNPLWSQYSTEAVAHTLEVYSKYTIDYPYPVAISVNGPVGGMEYPMICFNGPRPDKDGTYSARTKHGLISVIIHEVGHNFFPMIINSDERQWTWMDEGLNTFVQFLAEKEWDHNYPSRRGPARYITSYMRSSKDRVVPIMTNSESLMQFGNNAYGKPATALNILRETVMGRELFDYAFKEYATRWAFKHPEPADFFRTMEDASGVDLDWFWRGWFYTTDNVDISIENVNWYTVNTKNMAVEKPKMKAEKEAEPPFVSVEKNKKQEIKTKVETNEALLDFYNTYDPFMITNTDKEKFQKYYASLNKRQKQLLEAGLNFYKIKLKNRGGLVMPVIIEIVYEDRTSEIRRFPAEIWLKNETELTKMIITKKKVEQFILDPMLETADVDVNNNTFPPQYVPSRFELYKRQNRGNRSNPMRDAQKKN